MNNTIFPYTRGLLLALLALLKPSAAFFTHGVRSGAHGVPVGSGGSGRLLPSSLIHHPPLATRRRDDTARFWRRQSCSCLHASSNKPLPDDCFLSRVPPDLEGIPIPFVDASSKQSGSAGSFIECYADSMATCFGKEYTIGVPCDYAVAICYYDDDEELIPIELDDALMDDVFPAAEAIVAEEFGEELVLQRTPQTLTLVGELEEDEDEDDYYEDDEEDEEDEAEEVEVLLTFEHRDREYDLVRLLDPILLVGRPDPDDEERCLLLTNDESDKVMPVLEELFLDYHMEENPDAILP